MSIPAPLWLVWGPVKLALKATGGARKRRADDRRAARRDEKLVAALGHGAPTTYDTQTKTEPVALQRWAYLHRRAIAGPAVTAASLVALSVVTHLAPAGYGYDALLMAGVPPLVVVGAGWAWLRTIDPKRAAGRACAISATAAGVAWLVWPPFAAIPSPVPAARWWILALAVAAGMGIRELRFRTRPTAPPVVDMSPTGVWSRTVGAEGPLTGTTLTNVHRIVSQDGTDVGWQGDVLCVWGQHNATKVWAQRESIVGAYGRDLPDFAHDRTGNALVAHVMLTERDPFPADLKPKMWLHDDGTIVVGSYVDSRDCPMRFFTPGHGIHDFWLFGVKGSGKSVLASNILGSVMSRGWVVLHLTDLKGGMSLPEWKEVAIRFGKTAADGLAQLRRLDAIGQARMDVCERNGWKLLPINAEWPAHLGMTEEAPQLWKVKEAVVLAEKIKTLYRAVNVALMDISQMAELQQSWGGSNTLRTQAQAGNVGCGYVPKDQADLGFDHFHPDMKLIKKGSYHWFVTSPAESREVLVKVAHVDSEEAARNAVPGVPNPVDVAAMQQVDDEIATEAAKAAEAVATDEQAKTEGIGRDTVARALRNANREAGGPVRLNAVSKAFITPDMDEITRKRVDDTVRKALAALVEAGAAGRPERGMYEVAA